MSLLPVKKADQLETRSPEQRWLIEELWSAEAVGLIGGEPKCCKSLLALDLAVAVAAGKPALGRFPPHTSGRVLLYAAEDAPHVVRQRLEAIAAAHGLVLPALNLGVITAPQLRLDDSCTRDSLTETIKKLQPKLLVLDPFVRLHQGIDENSVAEVAPILAYLRRLQRNHHLAVIVVHHARKGSAHTRPGQALRGSSEFHAWGCSNLYLRRVREQLRLTIEHRAAKSPPDLWLELKADNDTLALRIVDPPAGSDGGNGNNPSAAGAPGPIDRIHKALAEASGPLTVREIQTAAGVRTNTVCEIVRLLVADGTVQRSGDGYQLGR
jgi:hypothetical protein